MVQVLDTRGKTDASDSKLSALSLMECCPIDHDAINRRLRLDNPWWSGPFDDASAAWPRRAHYLALAQLIRQPVQRAVVLLGARRVGKTTLLRQLITDACRARDLGPVLFASVDTPTYAGLSLEALLRLFEELHPHDAGAPRLVVFDEIQYLRDWERHLKDLVDRHPHTHFLASGSAGAALKRKSSESGAGRFTDFELPPLTFALDMKWWTAPASPGRPGRACSSSPAPTSSTRSS